MSIQDKLKHLPAVDEILKNEHIQQLVEKYSYNFVKKQIQESIKEIRSKILNLNLDSSIDNLYTVVVDAIISNTTHNYKNSLCKVINATGTILHTNLGRAKLSEKVKQDLFDVAFNYTNLEYDLAEGTRGSRYSHLKKIILDLTGAEDVLVVNNNAAAVMLALNTLANGKEVIISRGELVEIGGAFRVPEIIKLSNCILKEVGTTNKTHLFDYEREINENTGVLLKVHQSNYKIIGFTQETDIEQITQLAIEKQIPSLFDLGSGLLINMQKFGLPYEPTISELIHKGCDVVTFSGDKLLGGPQAGIIVGKAKYIQAMKKNQLTRALRVDKMTIATLEATLKQYYDENAAIKNIPVLSMLNATKDILLEKANYFVDRLQVHDVEYKVVISDDFSKVGGGSYPDVNLSTVVVNVSSSRFNANQLEEKLRLSQYHIVTRIQKEDIVFDVRTLTLEEIDKIVEILVYLQ